MSSMAESVWGVYEIRGKSSYAGPGMRGYDAEARVEDQYGNAVYVHVNDYESRHYTVSKTSIYDYMTGKSEEDPNAVYDEEYEKLSDAKGSKFYKVFDTLNKVITRMERGLN